MALAAARAKRSVDNVEVKASEMFGGGMGLFSTRNFKEGDVILMEKPFLKIPGLKGIPRGGEGGEERGEKSPACARLVGLACGMHDAYPCARIMCMVPANNCLWIFRSRYLLRPKDPILTFASASACRTRLGVNRRGTRGNEHFDHTDKRGGESAPVSARSCRLHNLSQALIQMAHREGGQEGEEGGEAGGERDKQTISCTSGVMLRQRHRDRDIQADGWMDRR